MHNYLTGRGRQSYIKGIEFIIIRIYVDCMIENLDMKKIKYQKNHIILLIEMNDPRIFKKILYGGKLWWGETLANLANDHKFAKFSQPNFMLQIDHINFEIPTVLLKCNLMPVRISHTVFHMLPASACGCACIYARQKIILAGNDAGSSPPSSVLHAGFFLYLLNVYTYVHRLSSIRCCNVLARFIHCSWRIYRLYQNKGS